MSNAVENATNWLRNLTEALDEHGIFSEEFAEAVDSPIEEDE